MLKHLSVLLATIVIASGLSARADDYKVGDLVIGQPWARASIGKVPNGAAYMTIAIQGAEADRLIAAESMVARRVELHTHMMDGNVMRMRPVAAIEIAPGEPTLLQPGGLHVMLIGLKSPLAEGERFPLTLVFERAGRVDVDVSILSATATQGPKGMMHRHGQGS